MAWTGTITDVTKQIINGTPVALVTFHYTDGVRSVDITERLTNAPPDEWAEKTKASRIAQLEAVDAIDIQPGTVPEPTPDPSMDALRANLRKLQAILVWLQVKKIALDYPALTTQYPAIATLLANTEQGIIDNWSKL